LHPYVEDASAPQPRAPAPNPANPPRGPHLVETVTPAERTDGSDVIRLFRTLLDTTQAGC